MGDCLSTQHAGPFVIDLEGERTEVNLEDRQVIGGLLKHPGHAQRLLALTMMRTGLVAEDGLQLRHIKVTAGTIDQPLEDGVEGRAPGEQQVTAVLDLEGGVTVVEV